MLYPRILADAPMVKILGVFLGNMTSDLDFEVEVTEIQIRGSNYNMNLKILRRLVLEFLHSQTWVRPAR